jgi:hypothetical protein
MRTKVVVGILLLAVGLLGVIALVSKALHPQSTSPSGDRANISPIAVPVSMPGAASSNLVKDRVVNFQPLVNPQAMVSAAPVVDTNAAAVHAEYVHQRIEELNALAMNDDVKSRDTILSELKNNPDKAIRAAALEAAIQFGDRSVVPQMQQIADETQDPEEKAKIVAAINYINLPSYTEYLAAHPDTAPPDAPQQPPTDTQPPNTSP